MHRILMQCAAYSEPHHTPTHPRTRAPAHTRACSKGTNRGRSASYPQGQHRPTEKGHTMRAARTLIATAVIGAAGMLGIAYSNTPAAPVGRPLITSGVIAPPVAPPVLLPVLEPAPLVAHTATRQALHHAAVAKPATHKAAPVAQVPVAAPVVGPVTASASGSLVPAAPPVVPCSTCHL